MYKLSLIIPCHNVDGYIKNIFDISISLCSSDVQIVIVDDGSTDNTWSELFNLFNENKDVILIRNYSASGSPGSARNLGLWRSDGIYVAFLDADDFIDTTTLLKMLDYAVKNELDICTANSFIRVENSVRENNFRLDVFPFYNGDVEMKKNNLKNSFFSNIWNRIYNRKFLRDNFIIFPDFYITEDFCFSAVSLLNAKKFGVFEGVLYKYTYDREGSTTRARVGEKGLNILNDLPDLINYFIRFKVFLDFKQELIERVNSSILYTYRRLDDSYKVRFIELHKELSDRLSKNQIFLRSLK